MKYFYLTAAGGTAGPETLERLCALMVDGTVTLATMVVPAGGEDWTPLARVLRFFYVDAAGATAGPVAFSELSRLNQVAALTGDAWVMEEGGSDWKSLAAVLTGAGVRVAAPAPAPRAVTAAFRPPATGKQGSKSGDTQRVSRTSSGKAPAGRQAPQGGITRMPFLVFSVLLKALGVLALIAMGFDFRKVLQMTQPDWLTFWNQHWTVLLLCGGILATGVAVLTVLRLRNIGWPWPLVLVLPVPPAGIWLGIVLASYPPRFARHRRFDTAARVIAGVIVSLLVAAAMLTMIYWKQIQEEIKMRDARAAAGK